MLTLGPVLTNQNAATVLRDGLARVGSGVNEVDCSGLAQVDSAAVAVLLALHRAASGRGGATRFVGVPAQLGELARLYGVDGLLGLSDSVSGIVSDSASHRH